MPQIDKYKFRDEVGIIPAIMKPLLDKRKEVSKEMNIVEEKLGKDSIEYKSLRLI